MTKPGFVEKYGAKGGSTVGSALGYAVGGPIGGALGTLGGVRAGEGLSRLAENRRGGKKYSKLQKELQTNSKMGLESLRHRQ